MIAQVILPFLPFQSILTSFDPFFDQFGQVILAKPKKLLECISYTLPESLYQISRFCFEAFKTYAFFNMVTMMTTTTTTTTTTTSTTCFNEISPQKRKTVFPYHWLANTDFRESLQSLKLALGTFTYFPPSFLKRLK